MPPNSGPPWSGSPRFVPPHPGTPQWAEGTPPAPPGGGGWPLANGPKMPFQLQTQRIMLFLMPVWTALMLPSLIRWENVHLFGVWDGLLAVWLVLPGAAALACGLLLRRGGRAVLYAIAGLCLTIVLLNLWSFGLGGPPVLQAIPFTVLSAIPLCFPSSWRYARAQREYRRAAAETDF